MSTKSTRLASETDSKYLLVSIIVRSMARASLSEALDSIASQSYPNIEVILVNAYGSGHPLPSEYCGQFPISFIDLGQPLDRCNAANVGLNAAYGHYIGFLDDDDLLLPEHISTLANALQTQKKFQIAYSGVKMIAYLPDGSVGLEELFNRPFHLPSLRAQNYIPMHAVLFERTLLDVGCRFDEKLSLYEDWDFWLQLAEYSDFLHVNNMTALYRNYGYSGFGLGMQADTGKIAAGRAALFDKWKNIWSGRDLSEALEALRDGVIHRQTVNEQEQQSSHNYQQKIDQLLDTLSKQKNELNEYKRQLAEVYLSTSWRFTAPLRYLSHQLRRLRKLI